MHLLKLLLFTLTSLLAISGCSQSLIPSLPTPTMPFIHRIDIQQGNVVTQEMVAQLRLGMNKKKVRFIMGTPIIVDTFHANRWDYIYTYQAGGGDTERRLVSTIFNDDGKLIRLKGDVKRALGRLEVNKHQDTSIQVPGEYKKSLLAKLKDSMPFTGEDESDINADTDSDDAQQSAAAHDEALGMTAEVETNAVTVPGGAPPEKKKGFFKRLVDAIGIGAEEEDDDADEESAFDPDDPKYRDPTDPDINR